MKQPVGKLYLPSAEEEKLGAYFCLPLNNHQHQQQQLIEKARNGTQHTHRERRKKQTPTGGPTQNIQTSRRLGILTVCVLTCTYREL